MSTLLESINRNDFQEVKRIILSGKHPDALLNPEKMTPLIMVSGCICEEKDRIDMVRFLVEHGCNVNSETIYGETALITAARVGHEEVIEYLLDHGARIDAFQHGSVVGPYDQGTALFFALKHKRNKAARLLINRGADINIVGGNDYTPLMCAIENECDQAIVQLLLDKGADCFHKGASGETAYSLAESRHTLSLIELLEKRFEDFLQVRCVSCGREYILGYNTVLSHSTPKDIDRISEMGGSFSEEYLPYRIELSKGPLSSQEQLAQSTEIRDIRNGMRSGVWICGACGAQNEFQLHKKKVSWIPDRIWRNYDHTSAIISLSISPDHSSVVTGGIDGSIVILDTATGKCIKTLTGHKGAVGAVAVSPDGKYLVSGESDHRIKIWDLDGYSLCGEVSGHANMISAIVFSPEGGKFVSGSWDKTFIIWDFADRKRIVKVKAHKNWVRSLAFSHDGSMIASGGQDDGVRLWNAETGVLIKSLKGMKSAYALTFSPDDTKLYAGGWETLSVFDIAADKNKIFSERFFEGVQALSLSKDGTRVLAGSFTDVILLDSGSLKKIETFHGLHKDTINCIAFGPDDKSFITGGKDHMTARWKIMV